MTAHCWKGRNEWLEERYGHTSPEYIGAIHDTSATCLLEDGHDGDHEWTPDSEIGISFEEAKP